MRVACLLLFLLPTFAHGYIAVNASRLTLGEVMLEFPTVLHVKIDRVDAERSAYLTAVTATLQGTKPTKPVRFILHEQGKLPKRLQGLQKGSTAVVFLGSVDNRSLIYTAGGWFLTRPEQDWERFQHFRDDFTALYAGTPDDLAVAVRTLTKGGQAVVPVTSKGVTAEAPMFVQYDADFPHRRLPARAPNATPRGRAERTKALTSKTATDRQQALVELAGSAEAEAELRTATTDEHPEVRLAAVVGLGRLPTRAPESLTVLAKLLADDDRFVCGLAAWALARSGSAAKEAVPALAKALADRNYDHDFRPHRAAEAAEAILTIAPTSSAAKPALALLVCDRMLHDHRIDSEGTRTAAARALGRCGVAAKSKLPDLTKCLGDSLPATRIAAAEAILLIGGDAKQQESATNVLTTALTEGDPTARIQAVRATTAKPDAFRPTLEGLRSDKDADVQREVHRALGK